MNPFLPEMTLFLPEMTLFLLDSKKNLSFYH